MTLHSMTTANAPRWMMRMNRAPAPDLHAALRSGQVLTLIDRRSDQAVMFCAARDVGPEQINHMATHARGLICLALWPETITRLGLAMQPVRHRRSARWGFAVSVEARQGITTGISAAERAHTIRVAAAPGAAAEDLVSPGHVFPLNIDAQTPPRGAGCDVSRHFAAMLRLVRTAGAGDGAVVCQVLDETGAVATAECAAALATARDEPTVREHQLSRTASWF